MAHTSLCSWLCYINNNLLIISSSSYCPTIPPVVESRWSQNTDPPPHLDSSSRKPPSRMPDGICADPPTLTLTISGCTSYPVSILLGFKVYYGTKQTMHVLCGISYLVSISSRFIIQSQYAVGYILLHEYIASCIIPNEYLVRRTMPSEDIVAPLKPSIYRPTVIYIISCEYTAHHNYYPT